jgi:hypothetical protein
VAVTTSPPSVSRLSRENVGASTSHNPNGPPRTVAGIALPLAFTTLIRDVRAKPKNFMTKWCSLPTFKSPTTFPFSYSVLPLSRPRLQTVNGFPTVPKLVKWEFKEVNLIWLWRSHRGFVYLTTLSASQTIQHRMVWLVNNKLERMWKEAVVAYWACSRSDIREVVGSNTDYIDWYRLWFSSVPPGRFPIHQSSYHSTLHNLHTQSIVKQPAKKRTYISASPAYLA